MSKKGVSLITVLLFMLVATIAATATFKWLTSENRSSATRMLRQEAYQSAIAGIENTRAWMTNHANDVGGVIKQYLENNRISIYKVANSALVAYPTVFNIVNGKVDILNCALGVVKKIADALDLTIDELLTLCDKNYSFNLFRSEQCHLVNRVGEINYVIDLLVARNKRTRLEVKPNAISL